MKQLQLTNKKNTLVDDKDFSLLKKYKWHTISKTYVARTGKDGKEVLLHRQLLKAPAGIEVDHIDGDPLNNQRNNLRFATHAENIRNRTHLNKNNRSGETGVSWFKLRGKWRARIMINDKEINLGLFVNKKDAIEARRIASKKYFGIFAFNKK